jgi:hypothetical protein
MRIHATIAVSLCVLASVAQRQTSNDQGAMGAWGVACTLPTGTGRDFTGSVRVDPLFQANAPARTSQKLHPGRNSPAKLPLPARLTARFALCTLWLTVPRGQPRFLV